MDTDTPVGTRPKRVQHVVRHAAIAASPEQIWDVISDVDAWPKWNPGVELVEATDGTQGAGAEYHLKGAAFDITACVDTWEPNKTLGLVMKDGSFGPVYWHRTEITIESDSAPADSDPGALPDQTPAALTRVTVRQEWAGSIPVYGFLFHGLIRAQFKKFCQGVLSGIRRSLDGHEHITHAGPDWWAPAVPLARRDVVLLATICAYAMVMGYATSLTGLMQHQIIESFHGNDANLGTMFFYINLGSIPGLLLLPIGDKIGRRKLLLPALAVSAGFTVASSLAPNLPVFTALQTVVRIPFFLAAAIAFIYLVEEIPAGARAYSLAVFTMTGGLGGGFALTSLLVVQIFGPNGWRVSYFAAVVGLITLPLFSRHMPETGRFLRAWHGARFRRLFSAEQRNRTALIFGMAALGALYWSSAARFQARYIQHGLGYSVNKYVLFTVVTTIPGGIGLVLGGRLADTIGRRKVGITAATVGALSQAAMYALTGAPLWILSAMGSLIGAMWVPALGSYTTELFPTSLRASASSFSSGVGAVAGAVSVFVVGRLIVSFDGNYAFAVWCVLPFAILSALLLLVYFPETAGQELEEISPDIGPLDQGIPKGGFGPF